MEEILIQLKKKECQYCKYYQEHFILISRGRVMSEVQSLDRGHCKRKRPNHKLMYAWDLCDDWELDEKLKML